MSPSNIEKKRGSAARIARKQTQLTRFLRFMNGASGHVTGKLAVFGLVAKRKPSSKPSATSRIFAAQASTWLMSGESTLTSF